MSRAGQLSRGRIAAVLAGLFASREVVRKIVTAIAGRKLFQSIPIAGSLRLSPRSAAGV